MSMHHKIDARYQLGRYTLDAARVLVSEMRYINYPDEWSKPPLSALIPVLCELFDAHPARLGTIIATAYSHTFPTIETGNVNQLTTMQPELFGSSSDATDVDRVGIVAVANSVEPVYRLIIESFGALSTLDENAHRTLERVCIALQPIIDLTLGDGDAAFNFREYTDQWRLLGSDERTKLAEQILAELTG